MSNSPPPQDKSESSLQGTFKKRKTQEIDRLIEARRTGTAPLPKLPSEAKPSPKTVDPAPPIPAAPRPIEPRRVSQPAQTVPTTTDEPRLSANMPRLRLIQALTASQRKILIMAMAIALIFLILIGGILLSSSPSPAVTMVALPAVSAQDVVKQLQKVGLSVTNVQSVTTDSFWKAKQEIQFDVQHGSDKGSFLALSYDSEQQSGADARRAAADSQHKKWETINLSNVIVAVAPETSPKLIAELNSHLTQYLVAPYYSFLPTSTKPVASATP